MGSAPSRPAQVNEGVKADVGPPASGLRAYEAIEEGDDLVQVEGLGEEGGPLGFDRTDVGAHEDERDVREPRCRAEPGEEVEAADPRHPEVAEDGVDRLGRQDPPRLVAVEGAMGDPALLFRSEE